MASYRDYHEAHREAVKLARLLGRETGILKAKEYASDVFQVLTLPRAENRAGFELRAEIVRPTDPL